MRQSLDLLPPIQIASPCTVSWDSMIGDDRSRHCGECELQVYNFAAMSTAEVLDLIRSKDGRLCVRLYRRSDGTFLTSDCPVGMRQRLGKAWRRTAALAASMLAALLTLGCSRNDTGTVTSQKVKWITENDPPCVVMGIPVIVPPPANPQN